MNRFHRLPDNKFRRALRALLATDITGDNFRFILRGMLEVAE